MSMFDTNLNDFAKHMNRSSSKHTVSLDKMKPGTVIVMQQYMPGTKPIEVSRARFVEGQKFNISGDFKGVLVGEPKDTTKKFHFEYVGYSEDELKELIKKEEEVNRVATKPEQK